jgi:hypothetical protein
MLDRYEPKLNPPDKFLCRLKFQCLVEMRLFVSEIKHVDGHT